MLWGWIRRKRLLSRRRCKADEAGYLGVTMMMIIMRRRGFLCFLDTTTDMLFSLLGMGTEKNRPASSVDGGEEKL